MKIFNFIKYYIDGVSNPRLVSNKICVVKERSFYTTALKRSYYFQILKLTDMILTLDKILIA